ncbi:MAG: 3-isopropylmalate/3-methylmalate dehydrogenase [Methanomassiliicoccales archaeon PtaU1.Bin124]|nr:MAG: 3-isopropylmalate/3-methylmalate dehydrogenase [Methanomassiliicoccales archaeon PtaU1.Bin124]
MKKVAVIVGDGIGPEVVSATVRVLEAMELPLELIPAEMGQDCFRRTGSYLPDVTLDTLKGSDCCLFGAITSPPSYDPTYRSPILFLRKNFDLYANVRPVRRLRKDVGLVDLNLTIVRENTEGMYTGKEREEGDAVILERKVSEHVCRRLVKYAADLAKREGLGEVTCVHKSNALRRSDGLFRKVFFEEMEGTGLQAKELLVDAAAAAMITKPREQACWVTLNLYGDILSDEAAALVGGLGFAPSGNYGDKWALFEPTHGSAPDIAGRGIANPTATLLTAVMMLRFLKMDTEARRLEQAVERAWLDGAMTRDAGGSLSTNEMASAVARRL